MPKQTQTSRPSTPEVTSPSPAGRTSSASSAGRAKRSPQYREARDEYSSIRQLREKNWIAAHIRERRYELEMTQKDVADQAKTSHSAIARLEAGNHMPTIAFLQRVLAVLDEDLLIGIERQDPGEEREREIAAAPRPLAA
ncbi:MAG: helix-turn-helix transcriptional regulator [Solirubrobacterales bacterium]|nr:helix-turn-helix transcriptional regulator [Solirubrobacterales bacterium]